MKINDKYILKEYIIKNNRINSRKCEDKWLKKNWEIKEYLENRFDYFNGRYSDVVRLIRDKHKGWPKCPMCGKYLNNPYEIKHCSLNCSNLNKEKIEKIKNTWLKKYGVKNISQSEEIKEKKKQTCLKHFGVENPSYLKECREKRKNTMLEKTGYEYNSQDPKNKEKVSKTWKNKSKKELKEIIEKRTETCFKHFGVDSPFKSEECKRKSQKTIIDKYHVKNISQSEEIKEKKKQTCLKHFGVEYSYLCKEILDKVNKTKHKNGTFNTSRLEERIYKRLCKDFEKRNVKRQYKEERYPFLCDFYIKSLDLFIECNFSWTHGNHWFNNDSKEDRKILRKWKNKNTDYYKNAIETWTVKDIEKRELANKNKLNYVVFWIENDYDRWKNKKYPNKFQNK